MGDVVELDTRRPHVTEYLRCSDCFHEFWSVHPAAAKNTHWECPVCHEIAAKGIPPAPVGA